MRRHLLVTLMSAASLFLAASGAQAAVVDMNAIGQTSVPYNPSDQSGYFGAAITPGVCGDLDSTGSCASLVHATIPTVKSSAPCLDPALPSDLWVFGQNDRLPDGALCYHGGPVLHQNETFALTWDAPLPSGLQHTYFAGTRAYAEQFLRDVADASRNLGSPYAVTTQYTDANGNVQNSSKFGGGCIDNGSVGGSQCEFGSPTGAGHDYPASACNAVGASNIDGSRTVPNTVCLTDAQLQSEVSAMATQTGLVGRTQPGYAPMVVLLTPPGVETCLDAAGKLCSANGSLTPTAPNAAASSGGTIGQGTYRVVISYATAGGEYLTSAPTSLKITSPGSSIVIKSPPPVSGVTGWYAYIATGSGTAYARQQSSPVPIGTDLQLGSVSAGPPPLPAFCSYHSQVAVGGTEVTYVVQPWTPLTGCDEPDSPAIPTNPTPQVLATDLGTRLVSPLSQSHISSLVDPGTNGWFALDGAEMNDNGGCTPLASGLDTVTLGSSSQNPYLLQREFNNAGALELEPNTYFGCAPDVLLTPSFVVPSAVNQGDVVQLDGSTTASTLIVPRAQYQWDFGDHTTATGPSVVHSYAAGGAYTITLTVTDRGGNTAHLSQTIDVLDQNGQVVTPSSGTTGSGGTTGGTTGGGTTSTGGGKPAPPPTPPLQARLLLMPQGLATALRSGIAIRVSANEPANGFAYVFVSRSDAKRAGVKAGRGPSVEVGRGTVSRITAGNTLLRLHLSRAVAAKLKRLKHVTLTVRLSLVSAAGVHFGIVRAAHY
jgi:PKD domain